MPHAAIVAVGSELLSGQITNRNAAWLSERLFALGIDVKLHLTVDDVEVDIVRALGLAAQDGDLVLITGGLGPTSDDLTRHAVARWAGLDLDFDQASWDHIIQAFARLSNRPVPESNRQQCYFPKSAKILTNNAGSANAFILAAHGKELWVLPGPPQEVEAIWTDHAASILAGRIPLAARKRLCRWRTIGKGESTLAELVEPLFQRLHQTEGLPLDVAYRAHQPYVELKLRFPEADADRYAGLCAQVRQTLSPWLYEVDDEDHAAALGKRLARLGTVDLYDGATEGHLLELLAPHLRQGPRGSTTVTAMTSFEPHEAPTAFLEQSFALNASGITLAVAGYDASGTWAVGIHRDGASTMVERASPYKGEAMRARNLRAVAYLAVKAWHEQLTAGEH